MTQTRVSPPAPRPARPPEDLPPRAAWALSAVIHGVVLVAALVYVLWAPKKPATVEVFELVSSEPPKLRPLTPKNPDPPPAAPQPDARAPEAPALTPKPKNPAPVTKPEPRKNAPPTLDTSLPVKDVARENANNSPVQVTNAPANPRMAMWAGRVKAAVGMRWNPPAGIDVDLPATTVVRFLVSMDGSISKVEVSQGSGNRQLDDEATRAVKRTENLPSPRAFLPASFSEDYLQVSYEFIYKGL